MEDNIKQPREIEADSILRLKRKNRCAIGTIIILGVLLLALILFIAIYIPNLDA
jgi:type IV secretory pathway component VirB8